MTQSSVPPDPSAKRRRLIKQFVFIAASIVVLSVGVCAVQTLNRIQRNTANPVRTGSQLRQIGEALAQYASANAGQYPPSFLALMRAQPIPPELFVCPNSSDRVAKGHNREQILEEFAKPGHCSFVYVGAGLKTPVEAKAVVAFDNPNHEEEISNVLFGDRSSDWESLQEIVPMLEDLDAGKNPPSLTTNLTRAEAQQIYDRKWRERMAAMQTSGWRIPTTLPAK